MANFDGVNYAKQNAVPSVKSNLGQDKGQLWVSYDEWTSLANFTTSDVLRTGIKIPAGAKVHYLIYVSPTNGGTLGIGIAGAATKYGAALAVSTAGALVPVMVDNANAVEDNVIVTPSVSATGVGLYKLAMYYSKI
jgi:hypothetical protein